MKYFAFVILMNLATLTCAMGGDSSTIIVAQDGSGQYRTIQEALNSVPANNAKTVIIVIKKGIYKEKLLVQKSNVALVGEDRDGTRIVYAELRENWRKAHNNADWGSAVINIDSTVSDFSLANLTVYNNYGALYGSREHQYAVWGTGTRIIIFDCNILGDGGDTISLWNKSTGMYYHSNCYFEGWVDFVCPRGWCYITDSRFYGHNLSASIWHDGSSAKDQKFVIRYSQFDGVPGFPLARHHRDAQFYLLDCMFTRNMADREIYAPKNSPNLVPWLWGVRHYFYNCHREGGDMEWFKDNLASAEGTPAPAQVTAAWTFGGRWDPEKDMPNVLPFVSLPSPREASYGIPYGKVELRWIPSRDARSHTICFGKEEDPPIVKNQRANSIEINGLTPHTTYYWRVDEVSDRETLRGPLWHFTTE